LDLKNRILGFGGVGDVGHGGSLEKKLGSPKGTALNETAELSAIRPPPVFNENGRVKKSTHQAP
jgi:hypothetical protein